MPLAASVVESRLPDRAENHRHAQSLVAHMPLIEYPSAHASRSLPGEATSLAVQASRSSPSLAERIQLLIKNAGGVSAIARRCGFSEGAVRSWRDGHCDISRERCVVLARTLGISLLWLVAGEGYMAEQASGVAAVEPAGEFTANQTPGLPGITNDVRMHVIDPRRLAAALKLLQSYIGMIGGSLSPLQRAGALAELYEILGDADDPGHIDRLVAFQTTLNGRLRQNHALIA